MPGAARNLLQPAKLARTLLYQSGIYRIAKSKCYGLHVGSGGHRIDGFLNLDADVFVDCDLVANANRVNFSRNAVRVIYASHLFEHIPRAKVARILAEWYRVLEPGGKLYLCVPNLEVLARIYLESLAEYETEAGKYQAEIARNIIYGGQTDKFDFHFSGYSLLTIRELLVSSGFLSVDLFDSTDIDFAAFHKGHSATVRGYVISLNVVATK